MTDATSTPVARKPGVVIFAAVINFITATLWIGLTILLALGMILGNAVGLLADAAGALSAQAAALTTVGGYAVLFTLLCLTMTMAACFVFVGIGLLRGSRIAWYLQIVFSVIGLLGFPVHTILNACLLVLLFRPATREYFGE